MCLAAVSVRSLLFHSPASPRFLTGCRMFPFWLEFAAAGATEIITATLAGLMVAVTVLLGR
jgi:hypothetical protein